MRVGRNLRGIRMILAIHSVKNTLIGVQSRGDLGEDCVIAKKRRTSRESYSTVPFRKAKWDITGPWVPANNNALQMNCSADQVCGTNTIARRSSYQFLPDASWVKRVLIGTGNCSSTDVDFIDNIILVVESYGALNVDLDGMDNDSIPIILEPSPEPQIIVITTPEPQPTPQTVPVTQPITNPVPVTNPVPATNPAPAMNPAPAVNPSPATNPAPSTGDLSPAELNPSPFIITPVSEPNNLNPVPGVNPAPAPMNPAPSPQPTTVVSGNFSVWLHVQSVPLKFQVTLIDEDENIPYTSNQSGPCMPAMAYWTDKTLGCPCNGNWIGGGTYNQSMTMGGREIVPDDCLDSSCPENFYINNTILYGNVRLNVSVYENGTIMNKTLEVTKMSIFKEIGYAFGVADITDVYLMGTLGSDNGQTNQPSPNDQTPDGVPAPEGEENPAPFTPDDSSNSGTPLHLATTITMIFVFLLMMFENTQ